MKKFFLALFYVFGFWFVPEVVKRIISMAQIEGLFLILLAVFGFLFIPEAAKSINSAAKTGIRLFFITVLKISWIIAAVFPHQSTAGIATSIGLSIMYPPLCLLKRQRRYAEIIAISIPTTVALWYVLYPINSTGIIICLILLVLAWLIGKNAIFVNSITKLFIDRDRDKF